MINTKNNNNQIVYSKYGYNSLKCELKIKFQMLNKQCES